MATTRKQVAFDLDTAALKTYYPNNSWNNAYADIKKHMIDNGYLWQQGSVYVSSSPTSTVSVSNILASLVNKYPWLNLCMRDCRQTNISREHSQNHIFDKSSNVPTREELKEQKRSAADIFKSARERAEKYNTERQANKGKQQMDREEL